MQKRLNDRKNKQNKQIWIFLAFVILLLLLLSGLRSCYQKEKTEMKNNRRAYDSTASIIDTISKCVDSVADTLARPDSMRVDTVKNVSTDTAVSRKRHIVRKINDTAGISGNPVDSGKIVSSEKKDTLSDTMRSGQQDTQAVKQDTTTMGNKSLCSEDTTQLWIYPDPSGGLHRLPQKIRFFSNRSCTIYWK